MNTRSITKALGKRVMITLSSGMVLGFVEWLGKRKQKKKEALAEARRRAHR